MISYVRGRQRRLLSDPEIVALYVGGTDSTTVALRAGCDAGTVLSLVRAAGEKVRRAGGRRTGKRLILSEDEICRRYREGESGSQLADAAGCTANTIYGVLKRCGVRRRPAGDSARARNAVARARRRAREPTP